MRVLFLVNGLGLGNATRCHAVIEQLHARGATTEVCSFGNGAWYLSGRPEVARLDRLEPVHYGKADDGRLSVSRTLAATGELLAIARRNDRRIAARLASLKPDVVVTDSVYSVRAVRRSGVPWVALNNADVVHASYHRFPDRPASIRAQFHAVEENDRRFHSWLPDRVVSPTLDPTVPSLGAPFHRIGPIVRGGLPRRVASGPPRRLLIMLSGSVFGSQVDLSSPLGLPVDVVGRQRGEDTPELEGVTWHGKVRDNLDLVRRADLAVVNGGFSAVSELFCLGTPMIVVPVPNHAEQWVNARTIEHLGVGAIGSEATLEDDLRRGLERLEDWRDAYRALPEPPRGAEQAADAILDTAGLRSPWT